MTFAAIYYDVRRGFSSLKQRVLAASKERHDKIRQFKEVIGDKNERANSLMGEIERDIGIVNSRIKKMYDALILIPNSDDPVESFMKWRNKEDDLAISLAEMGAKWKSYDDELKILIQ
jgi:hypothetical protein